MTTARYDVIVVGGGHAGIEAALAAARMGARCALVTHDRLEIGRMPCNPAVGGLGKGQLVREIDVLGGQMALAIDRTGIQFRILNRTKGPAVQSPRAQADKYAYQAEMVEVTSSQPGLEIIEGDAAAILTDTGADGVAGSPRRAAGVRLTDGRDIAGARVVLCTGTFLKGLMHIGEQQKIGGREGAASSEGLSASLRDLGFRLKRLKTGTPPRLLRASIDFDRLERQPGDDPPTPFSFRTRDFAPRQIECHLAYTGEETHRVIRGSLDRSPLYGGVIDGQGPRYCPSIEDKVVRFADKDRHLLFLEPEGRDSDEIYVNGLSTSLPADVQERIVRSVPGLERARIVRYGYAIEYDSIPSWQIDSALAGTAGGTVAGLYLAGQILGTSGYEEAAAQGLVAGVNAVRGLEGREPLRLGRDEAYVGVLIDDLVTKEISEPYRMFTSRAEHRLHLRCDNTEYRLWKTALELGLLPGVEQEFLRRRAEFVDRAGQLLDRLAVSSPLREGRVSGREFLRHPGATWEDLLSARVDNEAAEQLNFEINRFKDSAGGPLRFASAVEQIVHDAKYDGYIAKQTRLLKNRAHLDHYEIPDDLDYHAIRALSYESREKLSRIRPLTLGQAGRIDGVRAGDLAVLSVYLKRWSESQRREAEGRETAEES